MILKKNKLGILIIASYFLFDGLFISYQLANKYLTGQHTVVNLIYYLIPLGFLLSGLGLFMQKGWGRNVAILSCFSYIYLGQYKIFTFYYGKHDTWYLAKGITTIIFAVCLLLYLYKKSIRELYPDSPISLIIIGFTLSFYGYSQHSGNTIIDTFWASVAIVGLAITVKGGAQLRMNMGIIPQ